MPRPDTHQRFILPDFILDAENHDLRAIDDQRIDISL
jgi:hypothetical protein